MPPGASKTVEETPKTRTKYEYDKEWLRLVLNSLCPECEGQIERKGIKRYCTKNRHLEIYGNPITVAYSKIKPKKELKKPNYTKCPECGGTKIIEDIEKHEKTCANPRCGVVLAGPYEFGIVHPWHDAYTGID